MKKAAIIVLVILLGFALTGAAYARWGDCVAGYGRDVDIEAVKKFQKETLNLRDELITKRLELRKEYHSPTPNTERITALRKEIVDLQGKVQAVADKYGVSGFGPIGRMKGYGMMRHGAGHEYRYHHQGAGCPCPRYQ